MHFRSSSTFALVAAALTIGAVSEAGAQGIPRGGKEPVPCACDTVRIVRVDTVTMWRRDTLRVTQYDTVRLQPLPVALPVSAGGPYVGLGGGVVFPAGDFGNYEMGWNVTGMVGNDFRGSPFGWRLDATYDQLSERENTAGASADPTLYTVNGDLKFRMPIGASGRNHLYALGGLTYGRYKDMIIGEQTAARIDSPTAPLPAGITIQRDYKDNWGYNVGGGFSFGLTERTNLFVESRWIKLDGAIIPVVAGLTWTL
jgi:hypothetical protein